MARVDSQDSLAGFGRSFSSDTLNLADLPRNSSLGDLASLGVFNTSPFPSTDNLLSLVAAAAPSPQTSTAATYSAPTSTSTQTEWAPTQTPSYATGKPHVSARAGWTRNLV